MDTFVGTKKKEEEKKHNQFKVTFEGFHIGICTLLWYGKVIPEWGDGN